MKLNALAAAALAVACLATPALAADPPTTPLPLGAPNGTVYNEATYNDGSFYFPKTMLHGWTGTTIKPLSLDANGNPSVSILGLPLPPGASTSALQSTANGSLSVLAGAVTNSRFQIDCITGCSGSGGGSVPSGSAGSPSASVLSVQGVSGGTGVPVTGTFFQATQPVSAATLPLPTGAATALGVAAVVTALGTPLQAGGSVAVSNFPGTQPVSAASLPLPAGAATSAKQDALLTAVGTLLQPGGAVTVTGGPTATAQATGNTSLATLVANTTPAGAGSMSAVPAGSTNGTALGCSVSGFKGARFYLGTSDTVTFTVATSAPSSAPGSTYTISGATSGTGPNWDENLGGSAAIYVTAKAGSPLFRCY